MNTAISDIVLVLCGTVLLIGAVRFVKLIKTEHKNREYSFLVRIVAWIFVILGVVLLPLMITRKRSLRKCSMSKMNVIGRLGDSILIINQLKFYIL